MTEKRKALGIFGAFLVVLSLLTSMFEYQLIPYTLLEPVRYFIYLPITLVIILVLTFFISWNQESFTRMRAVYTSVAIGILACAIVFPLIKPSYTFIDASELVGSSFDVETTSTFIRWNVEKNYSDYVVQTEEDLAYAVDPYTGEVEQLVDGFTFGEDERN
ncbi:hypothetical protein ACFO0S_08155 [Chryseomicrobium palamuruense]|uniref:Uncharacterized protein n=1 Tax=Chryseomicrobium palamuruense TaxID=682973 RepID=A0ABV8UW31_9BACL